MALNSQTSYLGQRAMKSKWGRVRQKATARRTLKTAPQIDADPVGWIEQNFLIPETVEDPQLQGRIKLYPSQRVPLEEALSPGDGTRFKYSLVVWSAIKKSAKSSIAAAVALWFAFRRPYATVKIIANDLKQAESRVYFYVRRCLELNDKMNGPLAGRSKITNYRITLDNGSTIEAIPIDPKGEAGGNDDLVVYSEIWGWKTRAAQTMWTESTLSPLKFGQSMRWAETYAGSQGEAPVLEGLHRAGVLDGEQPDDLWREYEMYRNTAARQFTLWTTKPTLPWQTKAYYDQESASLDANEFDRVHRNQWTAYAGRVYPNFSRAGNVTDLADYNPAKGDVLWGMDDGFARGKGPGTESYHPRAAVLGQINELGGMDIFAEYEKAGIATHAATIDELLNDYGYPEPEAAYVDSSAQMLIATLWDDYDIYSVGATHPIEEGVKNMRRLICTANDVRLLRIHPRCKRLIECLEKLKFADTGQAKGGEMKVLKVDDHLPDALRYLCWPLRVEQ